MTNMIKEKKITYHVEGPDWTSQVELDTDLFETEREQIFEAATQAIEKQIKENEEINFAAVIIVRKIRSKKEALVNAYICLNNAAQYKIAESLRESFKKTSGQDLAVDETGYSY